MASDVLPEPVAAVWMIAAAYAVGYGPTEAMPMGHAYARARLVGPLCEDGTLHFGGIELDQADDGTIYVGRRIARNRFTRDRVVDVVCPALGRNYAGLLDAINTYLSDRCDVDHLDETDQAWKALLRWWKKHPDACELLAALEEENAKVA
jgi:hypothetical protein